MFHQSSLTISEAKDNSANTVNHYIHGTSSEILALLPKTQFLILSPIHMIEKFQLAPLGGEIVLGGLSGVAAESNTAFGQLHSSKEYSLETIISNYAKPKTKLQNKALIKNIKEKLLLGPQCLFSNINVLLVQIARAKQSGITNSDFITPAEIDDLNKKLQGTLQFYYLVLLLGKYISPNYEFIEAQNAATKKNITDAIYSHLTFESILNKIVASNLNLKNTILYPSPSDLDLAVNLLELPKISTVKYGLYGDKSVTLPDGKVFLTREPIYGDYSPDNADGYFHGMSKNTPSSSIAYLLEKFAQHKISEQFMTELHMKVSAFIPELERRINLLTKVLNKKSENCLHDPFVKNPFPIILIADNSNKISLIDEFTGEYRATAPLKLGKDIKLIATDSKKHQRMLLEYFKTHHLDAISVTTFDQLRSNKVIASEPSAINLRQQIIANLSKYITRIESHKLPNNHSQIDYTYGFWFFKNSRAINRKANYLLAKSLLAKTQENTESVTTVFSQVQQQRLDIIKTNGLFSPRSDYVNKIRSSELNEIIKNVL